METDSNETPDFRESATFQIEGDRGLLYKSLIRAQGAYGHATKGATNPHFQSKYADLADVLQATKPALNANGFAIFWLPETLPDGWHRLTFRLAHESGGHFQASLDFPTQGNVHELKSAFTYRRRILCECVMGVAPEDDDDGNAAAGKGPQRPPEPRQEQRREQKPQPPRQPATKPEPPVVPQKPANDQAPQAAPPAQPAPQPKPEPKAQPEATQGPPPARPQGDSAQVQARELIADLGYSNRWADRMLFLTGKGSWGELSQEQKLSFVSSLRTEKRLHSSLRALGYDGEAATERAGRDIEGFTSIAQMGDEDMATVLGQLEREAKMREISLDGAA